VSGDGAVAAWGAHPYVALTTFRRTGEPVRTPVWIAPGDNQLLVATGADTGKVKRLRHDSRVELQPCTVRGVVDEGAPVARGTATLVEDPEQVTRLAGALRTKYKATYRLTTWLAKLRDRKAGPGYMLRIVLDD
jgi:PPOX class probable F420-dependent enzyme